MEKTDAARIRKVVLDAGPIIHLDELGCLSVLSDFHDLLVPVAVWEEVQDHRPAALNRDIHFVKSPSAAIQNHILALCDAFDLDRGEKEALSLCFLHRPAVLLTDDAAVRLAAKAAGIRAHGTIGLIVRAIRRKQLSPADAVKCLENIPERSTLFIKKSLLKKIIEEVKKMYGL